MEGTTRYALDKTATMWYRGGMSRNKQRKLTADQNRRIEAANREFLDARQKYRETVRAIRAERKGPSESDAPVENDNASADDEPGVTVIREGSGFAGWLPRIMSWLIRR